MTTQPEQALEDNLVKQLIDLGYEYVQIRDEGDLLTNLKAQLEKHNKVDISDSGFEQILNHLNKGNVFDRAKILRDKVRYKKTNGEIIWLEFLDVANWCQNQFQVTRQISAEGTFKNRYDVTILINGLPLVQIELKRRGLELKEAFNQTNRYQRHSYTSSYGLFNYIQLFVISNGVNTKYYANNRRQSFKQTFYWTDTDNTRVSQLSEFTDIFLDRCHVSKMICQYTVLHDSDKVLMVLRPYQYYAAEAIIDRVKNSTRNGYIWHTTGSGKTLTSFKTSQVLMNMPNIHKVVFVVDRKDLDYQTTKEFNSFSAGSIDGTDNTAALVRQFSDNTKLIVTTIQKLNTAISKKYHLGKMDLLKDKKMVFIFDECHRSQFGETHKRIKNFFNNVQMFGFTGTPIFAENAIKNDLGKRTTKDLFDEKLHQYVITDAIRDENVLKFAIEYVGKYKQKEASKNNLDIDVEAIDTSELLESDQRLGKIVDYVIDHHARKTHNRNFTAMMCVGSIPSLIKYYETFKTKKEAGEHKLKIGTIFSYGVNEDDPDADGSYMFEVLESVTGLDQVSPHSRDKLETFIGDYNSLFNTKFTTKDSQSFYNYYNDIARRAKNKELDLLLVVNMFLTGFDSPWLNTLFVDKNLRYHGLVQAYSRTNRILNELKSQGNIVAFRNLKKATDEAITLFANKEAIEEVIVEPLEVTVEKFNAGVEELKAITPTVNSVDGLVDEEAELRFIKAFRNLMRINNQLVTFADFDFTQLAMTGQEFEDYKSKYLDLYEKVKTATAKEKVSILDDVDFEVELIHRDEINVRYILQMLSIYHRASDREKEKIRKQIADLLGSELELRSKRELILEFIDKNMPDISDADLIDDEFEEFWSKKQREAFERLCQEEGIKAADLQQIITNYLFTEQRPMPDVIIKMLERKPKVLERRPIIERITKKILNFVDVFINGIDEY
ncbi:MAG: type restriction enzyme subunit [Blastocatellia bacterium]|jgi:type I restriction enzyme R subunit|nr:type restriction enzyme subunit [Blastocatellia bacterium]